MLYPQSAHLSITPNVTIMKQSIKFLALLSALILPLASSIASPAPAQPLIAGSDYVLIEDGKPWQPLDGKIEVVEIFAYWCSHCAQFQPMLSAWASKLPDDVRVDYLPAIFNPNDNFPNAFFAARQLTKKPPHDAIFIAVSNKELQHNASIDVIASYYEQYDFDVEKMKLSMSSDTVKKLINAAHQFEIRSGVDRTPTLIINGHYRITPKNHEDALRIADQLIKKLRSKAH